MKVTVAFNTTFHLNWNDEEHRAMFNSH